MDEDLKKLLEENLRISQENHQMLKSMKRHFLWQKVISVFYFILIVGPIIVGVVFLPSLLKPIIGQYQELLGGASLVNDGTSAVKITPDLINQLKSLSK
jgi:uncharacterized membrane protein (DUF106 family)